jgi:hypothetical protein
MLGVSLGFMVYLGVPMLLLDRFLLIRFTASQSAGDQTMLFSAHEHRATPG